MTEKKVIALAGAGDMAKYIVDAALHQGDVQVVVLSRCKNDWFEARSPDVSLHVTDYSVSSLKSILDSTGATALFSLIHSFDRGIYFTLHRAMLEAVQQSQSCKRFSPSYYGGNIDKLPGFPRIYKDIHQAFHDEITETAGDIQWTVINQGWIMDYIAIFKENGQYSDKSYMKSQQTIWAIDMLGWKAVIPGTGKEPATFTSAGDVGKGIVALATTPEPWQNHTYLQGEVTTWDELAEKLEAFYGRKFVEIKRKSLSQIQKELESPENANEPAYLALLQTLEWTALGGQCLPQSAIEAQREQYFKGIHFRTLDEVLAESKKGFI